MHFHALEYLFCSSEGFAHTRDSCVWLLYGLQPAQDLCRGNMLAASLLRQTNKREYSVLVELNSLAAKSAEFQTHVLVGLRAFQGARLAVLVWEFSSRSKTDKEVDFSFLFLTTSIWNFTKQV